MNRILAGGLAGLAATVPMSALMLGGHQQLPWWQRYHLPPRQITEQVTRIVGVHHRMGDEEQTAASVASHFGFGASAGAIYGLLASKVPAPPVLKGVVFGLMVWSVSYLGLLPAANLLSPATRHPAHRNFLMVLAHVLWGACLGLATDALGDE